MYPLRLPQRQQRFALRVLNFCTRFDFAICASVAIPM